MVMFVAREDGIQCNRKVIRVPTAFCDNSYKCW